MNSLRRTSSPPVRSSRPPSSLLSRLSSRTRTVFRHHGYRLASHPIAFLLLVTAFICSLLSPALSIWLAPDGPTSTVVRRGRGELVWELEGLKRQGVIWSEDEVCWDRLAEYYAAREMGHRARVVRMEQVLVQTDRGRRGGRAGTLSKQTLHQTWIVQKELERRLLEGEVDGLTCVRDGENCASSSPANWWSSEEALLADEDVHSTLSLPSAQTALATEESLSLPLTTTNTLVGVGRDRRGTVKGARYLTMSFYLEDTSSDLVLKGIGSETEESARSQAKVAWRRAVREVMAGKGWGKETEQLGGLREGRGQGRRVILKHLPHLLVHQNPRLLEDTLFAIGYLVVALYVALTMRRLTQVYSKPGLLLTGIVGLVTSGIMSLSVCWILGLSIGLVPWTLIPFLVLVCGVDNMFVLTKAVSKTDVSLSVPDRVAEGLSSVGLSTSVTLLVELSVAALLLQLISIEVIRQLVTFTVVALVVDYGMEMTFFATVLAIDLQRLELADLLQQGSVPLRTATSSPSDSGDFTKLAPIIQASTFSSLLAGVKSVLRQRAARTSTFAFLIFINLLLYSMYGADHYLPAFCSEAALAKDRPLLGPSLAADLASALQRGQRGDHARDEDVRQGAGAAFWKTINPANASSVHVYVEPVTVIKFHDDGLVAPESASSHQIVETSVWLRVGIFVGPIGALIVVLYLLLLYLLKDADLIEVQRLQVFQAKGEKRRTKGGAGVELVTLRGRHAADVELLASGKDVVASWAGLDDHVVIWQRGGTANFKPTHLEIPITAEPPSLLLLALDGDAKFCAAATRTGRILVWALERKLLLDFSPPSTTAPHSVLGPATHLFPSPTLATNSTPAPPGSLTRPLHVGFFSIHQNGYVVLWDCTACLATVVLSPPTLAADIKLKSMVVFPLRQAKRSRWPLVARVYSTGQLVLHRSEGGAAWDQWPSPFDAKVTTPADPITAVAFGEYALGAGPIKSPKSVLVVGTLSGLVSLYDLEAAKRICMVAEMEGAVRQIRLCSSTKSKCSTCAESMADGFVVVCSTRQTVSVLRVFAPANSSPCPSCNSSSAPSSRDLGRSSSKSSLRTPNKARSSSQSRSSTDEAPYPPPTHGFHLRRGNAAVEGSRTSESSDRGMDEPTSTSLVSSTSTDNLAKLDASLRPATSVSAPPAAPVLTNGSPSDIPLFNTSLDQTASGSEANEVALSDWPELRCLDVATTLSDERGGWELIDRTVVGVRRHRATKKEKELPGEGEVRGTTAWEVWSISTSPLPSSSSPLTATDNRLIEGSTSLEHLLSPSPIPATPPTTTHSPPDALRRRITPFSPASSPLRSPRPTALVPTIRFEDVALPFSRARPVISAPSDAAMAVGLGNSVAVITLKGGGPSGLLSLPSMRSL